MADAYKSLELARCAWTVATGGEGAAEDADPNQPFSRGVLKPGGSLVMKLLQVRDQAALLHVCAGSCLQAVPAFQCVHAASVALRTRHDVYEAAACWGPHSFPQCTGKALCRAQARRSLLRSCGGTLPRWRGTAPRPRAASPRKSSSWGSSASDWVSQAASQWVGRLASTTGASLRVPVAPCIFSSREGCPHAATLTASLTAAAPAASAAFSA